MPNLAAIHTTIRTRFKTLITDAESIVTQFDNQTLITRPDEDPYIDMSIYPQPSQRRTIGENPRRVRHFGEMRVQIFTPLQRGDNAAWVISDTVKDAFTAITVSGVKFTTPIVTRLGRSNDGKWWQILVVCPYRADETTP